MGQINYRAIKNLILFASIKGHNITINITNLLYYTIFSFWYKKVIFRNIYTAIAIKCNFFKSSGLVIV